MWLVYRIFNQGLTRAGATVVDRLGILAVYFVRTILVCCVIPGSLWMCGSAIDVSYEEKARLHVFCVSVPWSLAGFTLAKPGRWPSTFFAARRVLSDETQKRKRGHLCRRFQAPYHVLDERKKAETATTTTESRQTPSEPNATKPLPFRVHMSKKSLQASEVIFPWRILMTISMRIPMTISATPTMEKSVD
mmetsp:Transcript_103397/g.211043  ORF Transcript_103397/g.211043 Transcript_103397/m.211043 type:complete len:191 (+) Transcript_103397:775-1347(+)